MSRPNTFPREVVPPTVWNRIEAEARAREVQGAKVITLHVGDTHLPTPRALTEPVPDEEHRFPRLNRYGDTYGELPLREVLADKLRRRNGLPVTGPECVQVTAGATGALHAAFTRLLEPGDEVLTLAPYWSILRQVADSARVKLVEAPFYDELAHNRGGAAAERLTESMAQLVTPRTAGVYLNTPSNPTGLVLQRDELAAVARFAEAHDLWVFSDEAYEDFIWNGSAHHSFGALPGAWERTVSVFTMSKCFGVSGLRVGYAAGPAAVVSQLNRAVVGGYYQAGRTAQLAVWRGMMRFEETVSEFRRDYEPTWRWVKDNLRLEHLPCAGGFYFWVRLGHTWRDLSPEAKVERMLEGGVVLAPGEYFGKVYREWARMCFTATPPDELKEGVRRMNQWAK